MYRSDDKLAMRCATLRRSRTKCNADAAQSGENSSGLVLRIVAARAKHEHGDGAEAADEQVPHSSVVVDADRGEDRVVLQTPGNRHSERERESDCADRLSQG